MEKCVALVKDENKNVFYNVKIKMLKTGFGCLKKGKAFSLPIQLGFSSKYAVQKKFHERVQYYQLQAITINNF